MTVPSDVARQWQDAFRGTMLELVGFSIVSASKELVVAAIPYRDDLRQVTGLFHAGVILTLADSAATALANLHLQPSTAEFDPARFPLTVQLSANFIRNRPTNRLVAEAVPVHAGRRTIVVRTDVRDAEGRLFATVTSTLVPALDGAAPAPQTEAK